MVGFAELEQIDKTLTLAINGFHFRGSDALWIFFSEVKVWIPLYALVLFLMYYKLGWRRATVFVVACALCVLCVDQGANVVKAAVGRLRPCHTPDMILDGLYLPDPGQIRSGNFGFFSAHAGNAMTFAVCSSIALARSKHSSAYTLLIVSWALLVGLSRVFKGAHYLGDVVVGWVAGAAVALIIAWVASSICKLWKSK